MKNLRNNFIVGFFLAFRDIKRSNKWTTLLIIFIMTITFLNLVVVRGILIGLVSGANVANKSFFSSDVIITAPKDKTRIEGSAHIIETIKSIPAVERYTQRYTTSGRVEAGYRDRIRKDEKPESVGAIITGIIPSEEDAVTGISTKVVEGEFLSENEMDMVVVGSSLLGKYTAADAPGTQTLRTAQVGSKVRLTINNNTREVTIKGVIKTKSQQIDLRVFINEKQLRQMLGRADYDVNEIAVQLKSGESDQEVKNILIANDADKTAIVQTALEGRPSFVKDIEETFNILGNVIGSIGLAVATISIFIVIFVNAITRRKFIGILKGIGVTQEAIQLSYMIQSFFYALSGIFISIILIFGLIKPYFEKNPINFPFSDGVMVATVDDVILRAILLLIATIFAGYVPARIVVKQHTLDAILGR